MKKSIKTIIIIIFWLAVWECVSLMIDNPILMAGPYETVKALAEMAGEKDFWLSLKNSFLNITGGIILGCVSGVILACLSGGFSIVREMLSPFVKVIKSIPVVSFVVIILLWCGNEHLSLIISALITFPIFYLSILEGLKGTDKKQLEMAAVFKMKPFHKVKYIYMPALRPAIMSAVQLAVGMGWRSGAAAEVIGQPLLTMGNGLYRSKIFLATDRLFAWTVMIILVSVVSEKLFKLLAGLLYGNKNTKADKSI
ncbi:MAG: ABC transporter permease subunit [Eubacterium sp.]|nr:ABC transporter permease subunit [Eubacterium sp.]